MGNRNIKTEIVDLFYDACFFSWVGNDSSKREFTYKMQLQVGVFWEAYSEPSQTCNMELFDRVLNVLLIFTQLLIKTMKHDKKRYSNEPRTSNKYRKFNEYR